MTITTIYELINKNSTAIKMDIKEDFNTVNINFSLNKLDKVSFTDFYDYLNCHQLEDTFFLSFLLNDLCVLSCDLTNVDEVHSFNHQILEYKEEDLEPPFDFSILVQKKKTHGKVNIYNLTSFIDYMIKLEVNNILELLHKYSDNNGLFFKLIEDEDLIVTSSFIFSKNNSEITINLLKDSVIEKSQYNINRNGSVIYDFLPNDFYLKKRSTNEKINNLFDRLCLGLCFIYFSNYSEFNTNIVTAKIIGYKTINLFIDLKQDTKVNITTLTSYFQMYSWIYESESPNTSDKCGICRNILSLYLNNDNILNINDDLYSYALSCNEIYLKENINKYIEIKGNVINLLNELNTKLLDVSKTFSNKLRNNLVALVTFYFSTLLMNTIATGAINNIFTKDIATISYAFILCSFVYYTISLIDYNKEKDRYKLFYEKQKKFYSDVLIEKEIQDIFMNDEPYKNDLKEIRWTGIRYSILWFLAIIIAILVITYLSGFSPFDIIYNLFIVKKAT